MVRIAIYARKSKFTAKGESIENQIKECQQYISAVLKRRIINTYGDEEIEEIIYKDEGYSGKNLDRPEFKKMMADNDINKFSYIVVYRLDRVSRNLADFSQLTAELKRKGTAFISYKEDFDTATPMGQAMMSIAAVFAQLERDTIAERIKDNMYQLAKLGHWTGGTTPLGYKSIQHMKQDGSKTRTYYTLQIDESQVSTVKLIFEKYEELQSINALEKYLNQHNIYTQKGKQWTKTNVRRILINPIYCAVDEDAFNYFTQLGCTICFSEEDFDSKCGILSYNRTSTDRSSQNPPDKWLIAASIHEPILSGKSWVHVQNILKQNSRESYGGKTKERIIRNNTSILSGVLMCKCGAYMRPKVYASGNIFYVCERKDRYGSTSCSMKNLNGAEIDAAVVDDLFNYEIQDNSINNQISELKNKIDKIDSDIALQIKKLERQKTSNSQSIKKLVHALTLTSNNAAISAINEQIIELSKANDNITNQIDTMSESDVVRSTLTRTVNTFQDVIRETKDNFDILNINQRREFIKSIIEKIVWDGESANIFIKGSM